MAAARTHLLGFKTRRFSRSKSSIGCAKNGLQTRSVTTATWSNSKYLPISQVFSGCQSFSLSNSKSLSGSLLLGDSNNWFVSFGNMTTSLNAVQLDVAVWGNVWCDTTMSTVGSSAAIDSALDSNVADNTLLWVKSLCFSVALQVDKQFTDSFCRLLWPSTIWPLVLSNLGVSGDVLIVPSERNNLFMSDDSFHIRDSSWNSHALNVIGSFEGVLKVSSEVRNLSFGGCNSNA